MKSYHNKRRNAVVTELPQNVTVGVTDKRTKHLAEALITPERRARLILISKALDKTMTGLDSKPLRLSSMVRYGIGGFTYSEIKELL